MEHGTVEDILASIKDAEMVLVGIGEEFDGVGCYRQLKMYEEGKNLLLQSKQRTYIPAWQNLYRRMQPDLITDRLEALAEFLEGKNYFVVSVSTNSSIAHIPWKEGRLVMPCGSDLCKQCSPDCQENLKMLSGEEQSALARNLEDWRRKLTKGVEECLPEDFGVCPKCKAQIELNNIYSEQYDENGYLPEWQIYTKWLQGTVNRRLVVLELGVGMKFPSVIRFPFEKIAYFNQKAKFYRINKNLYHLTEELAGKGIGIADNAIDWLENLC